MYLNGGVNRGTEDIDLIVSIEEKEIKGLIEALKERGYNVSLNEALSVLGKPPDPGSDTLKSQSIPEQVDSIVEMKKICS